MNRSTGLTLVELMVASAILMIAVAGSIASQLSADRLVRTSQQTAAASADLQACMEQVRLWSFNDLDSVLSHVDAAQVIGNNNYVAPVGGGPEDQLVGSFVGLLNGFDSLHLQGQRVSASFPNFVVGGAVPDPLEVRLTCTWADIQGRNRQLRLSSLKTK